MDRLSVTEHVLGGVPPFIVSVYVGVCVTGTQTATLSPGVYGWEMSIKLFLCCTGGMWR